MPIKSSINFTGRVLDSPQVLNGDRRMPFYQPGTPPTTWCIFALSKREITKEELNSFAVQLMSQARALGLNLAKPNLIELVDIGDSVKNIYNVIQNIKKWINLDFVLIGIPSHHAHYKGQALYNYVKLLCDQMFSTISQCFRLEHVNNPPPSFFEQFLLKTNAKLGGRNTAIAPDNLSRLSFDTESTIMIGIAVSPLTIGEQFTTSVVAVVGSQDNEWSQYASTARVQRRGRSETIEDLEAMIFELLRLWVMKHRTMPRNLIVFRDGVSDSDVYRVRTGEIPLVEAGMRRMSKSIRLMFILTSRNHNVGLAQKALRTDGKRPTFNIPPGTVFGPTVTNPKDFVFYLYSHFSPVGASTKYTIVRNDLNMNADQVEEMVYFSCFNSARARSVIRQPTAVRYANLLAQRAKAEIEARLTTHMDVEMPELGGHRDLIQMLNAVIKVDDSMRHKLYYC